MRTEQVRKSGGANHRQGFHVLIDNVKKQIPQRDDTDGFTGLYNRQMTEVMLLH